MVTTGERLVELSGLGSDTSGNHLVEAGVTGPTSGEWLVSQSTIPTGAAYQHLLFGTGGEGGDGAGMLLIQWRRRCRR